MRFISSRDRPGRRAKGVLAMCLQDCRYWDSLLKRPGCVAFASCAANSESRPPSSSNAFANPPRWQALPPVSRVDYPAAEPRLLSRRHTSLICVREPLFILRHWIAPSVLPVLGVSVETTRLRCICRLCCQLREMSSQLLERIRQSSPLSSALIGLTRRLSSR